MTNSTQLIRIALLSSIVIITFCAIDPLDVMKTIPVNDKVNHILAFFVLATLVDYSYPESQFRFFYILLLIPFGLLIEVVQYFIPLKQFSLYDLGADCIGLALYWLFILVFKSDIKTHVA